MQAVTVQLSAHLAFALLLTSLVVTTAWRAYSQRTIVAVLLVSLAISFAPSGTGNLASLLLGLLGSLSITTLLLLIQFCLFSQHGGSDRVAGLKPTEQCIWIAIAIILYVSALGQIEYDLYAFGMRPLLTWLIPLCSLAAFISGQRFLAICLQAAAIAYALGLYDSNNYWDYLVDPLLLLIIGYNLFVTGVNRLRAPAGNANPAAAE